MSIRPGPGRLGWSSRSLRGAVLALLVLVTVAGATAAEPVGTGRSEQLVGRTFLAQSVTVDGEPWELARPISMRFSSHHRIAIQPDCNTWTIPVTIRTNWLAIGGTFSSTMARCFDRDVEQARLTMRLLASSPAWHLAGDELTLAGGGVEIRFLDREVADPDRPLVGTRWRVDHAYLNRTDHYFQSWDGEEVAWLLIDGTTFRAGTGCREIEGEVLVGEGWAEFRGDVAPDWPCPAELTGVDTVLARVLTGRVSYFIEGAELLLNTPGSRGTVVLYAN